MVNIKFNGSAEAVRAEMLALLGIEECEIVAAPPMVEAPKPKAAAPKKIETPKKAETPAAEKAPTPAAEDPAPVPEAKEPDTKVETVAEEPAPMEAVDKTTLRAVLVDVKEKIDPTCLAKIFREFGVKKLSELPEEKYMECYNMAVKLLAEAQEKA